MVEKMKVKPIDSSAAKNYQKKASDFYDVMELSYRERKWNAVGLNAVHCAISASDALLAKYGGIRNTSSDHKEAADILVKTIKQAESKQYAKCLRKILGLKNLIEYEKRLFTETDSTEILKPTQRFYEWAVKLLA